MIIQMYSIYDMKAKAFNRPFFMMNDDVAIRACKVMVNDEKSDFHHNPQDFVLFRVAAFNDADGSLSGTFSNTGETFITDCDHVVDFKSLV